MYIYILNSGKERMVLAPGYMYLMIFDAFLFVQIVLKVSTCNFFTLLFFASSLRLKNNRRSHGVVVLGTPALLIKSRWMLQRVAC